MKKLVSFIMVFSLCFSFMAMSANAMDKRVSASKSWVASAKITSAEASKYTPWKKGYYKAAAKGYITAKQTHTATARLYLMG